MAARPLTVSQRSIQMGTRMDNVIRKLTGRTRVKDCRATGRRGGDIEAVVTFNARDFAGVVEEFGIELLTPVAILRRM